MVDCVVLQVLFLDFLGALEGVLLNPRFLGALSCVEGGRHLVLGVLHAAVVLRVALTVYIARSSKLLQGFCFTDALLVHCVRRVNSHLCLDRSRCFPLA